MDSNLPDKSTDLASPDLAQLLRRADIWRGRGWQSEAPLDKPAVDTGYVPLNEALLHRGWPLSSLVEICQAGFSTCEWQLLSPALKALPGGFIVLLNPPFEPFVPGLIQAGFDLDQILVVRCARKADFLLSFVELARATACDAIVAWQPKELLSYTELRKCLLASAEGKGLYVLFRPMAARQQSSPAALRLTMEIQAQMLRLAIFKQKGRLQAEENFIHIPIPASWQGYLPFHLLHHTGAEKKQHKRAAKILPMRRG